MKTTQIYLPEPIREWLKETAKKTDTSMAEHVRRAIDDYREKLKQQEQKQKK